MNQNQPKKQFPGLKNEMMMEEAVASAELAGAKTEEFDWKEIERVVYTIIPSGLKEDVCTFIKSYCVPFEAYKTAHKEYSDICLKCRGKGYSTEFKGYTVAPDMPGDVRYNSPIKTEINYCDCQRGKQIRELLETARTIAEETHRELECLQEKAEERIAGMDRIIASQREKLNFMKEWINDNNQYESAGEWRRRGIEILNQ